MAFSGGVDSALLLCVARQELGERAFAVTAESVLFPESEKALARSSCASQGVPQVLVQVDSLAVEGLAENTRDRCYVCKRNLLEQLQAAANAHAEQAGLVKAGAHIALAEGSNASDRADFRPGARAVAELGVLSPLEKVGLTKADVRDLARCLGVAVWNKPSYACLASRIPYGQPITEGLVERIASAEQLLVAQGFAQVRVRVHDHGSVARVEVPADQILRAIHVLRERGLAAQLQQLGFKHVCVDALGYVTGSMN